jgi:hypothetical protein
MSRSIREQVGVDAFPTDDDKPEPMDDAECGRRCRELSRRLKQTIDAIDKQKHPATASDIATMNDVVDFFDELANGKATEESLRSDGLPTDAKSFREYLTDEGAAARQSKQVREWLRK